MKTRKVESFVVALLVLLAGSVAYAQADLQPFTNITEERELPKSLRWSWDVRWDGAESLILAVGTKGTCRLSITDTNAQPNQLIAGHGAEDGLWLTYRVAASDRYLVAGGPLYSLMWKAWADTKDSGSFEIDTIEDLDVFHNQLLLAGAQRGEKGEWVPDGAIAWIGSLDKDLADLQPVYYSVEGPGTMTMGLCGCWGLSKVRFLSDGWFVVAPMVEPGIYLYKQDHTLARVWDTKELGIDAECNISMETSNMVSRKMEARHAWMNQRRLVDEILPLGKDIGLVIRTVTDGRTHWQIKLLSRGGKVETHDLPYSSPSVKTHLQGDVKGNRVVFVTLEYGTKEQPPDAPTRLIFAELSH